MAAQLLDDRTFESATTPTAEEQLATAAHFEQKGYEVEVVPEEGEAPAEVAPETVPPAAVAPADTAPPDDQLDPESRADWQSANNDGERLGKYAKRTKQLHELKTTVSEKEAEIERLKQELATRATAPATPPLSPPASVVPPSTEQPKPEAPAPIKAKEFEKAKPARPTIEDFADEVDPHAALAAAAMNYADQVSDWKDEKRAFEDSESIRVRTETQQQEQQAREGNERKQFIQTRFADAVREYPDLTEKTAGVAWPSVVRYLLTEEIPDGFKIGYQLAKPENAALVAELISKLPETNDPNVALRLLNEGRRLMGTIEYRLAHPASAPPAAPPAAAAPPAPPVPPSVPPPRREEAAPLPVRAHGVPAVRPEDVNPMDSDARRALRGASMKTNMQTTKVH